jgi:hypothetical protein
MDIDGALVDAADGFLPAGVIGSDFAPIAGETGDEPRDAFGIDVAGVEFEVPVLGADGVPEPLRFLFGCKELAEQMHGVPIDKHAAQIEDGDERL